MSCRVRVGPLRVDVSQDRRHGLHRRGKGCVLAFELLQFSSGRHRGCHQKLSAAAGQDLRPPRGLENPVGQGKSFNFLEITNLSDFTIPGQDS